MTAVAPIAEGLFTWPSDEPRLIGGRCADCGTHNFPLQDGCPRCSGAQIERVELARRGTLWTWTVQAFAPKSPPYLEFDEPFEPYGVGYIDLPGQLRVEARLTVADPEQLQIGMEMELVVLAIGTVDGQEIVTFAFRPLTETEIEIEGAR